MLVPVVGLAGADLSGAQAPSLPPPVRPSPNICLPGAGSLGWCGDGGPATSAKLAAPNDVALAPDGSLVIADTENQVIRAVDTSGRIATIAGTGVRGDAAAVVSARRARFRGPAGVAVDTDGSVLVADTGNNAIRRIELSGRVVTVVGSGLRDPADVVALPTGGYAVADSGNHRVVHVSAAGAVTRIAGTGVPGYSGDGGPAAAARLKRPLSLATSSRGLLIVDAWNRVVRLVAPDGSISTVAGGPPGSTPASNLALESPVGVAATAAGFVVSNLQRVWHVSADGSIQPFAGTGVAGFNGDSGAPGALRLDGPAQLAASPDGAILLADPGNDRIRRVAPDGSSVLTLAGSDDPNVQLAPLAIRPFLPRGEPDVPRAICGQLQRRRARWRICGPRRQRGTAYALDPGGRAPACSTGTTKSNQLKIQPYSDPSIESAERPVDIDFGLSVDARSLKAFAWRKHKRYGTRTRKQNATTGASIRLRTRLSRNSYYAVVEARTKTGEHLCDSRKMVVK